MNGVPSGGYDSKSENCLYQTASSGLVYFDLGADPVRRSRQLAINEGDEKDDPDGQRDPCGVDPSCLLSASM